MTDQQLTRAQEIKIEIDMLKSALSQLNASKIFNTDDSLCSIRGSANPFLSELNIELKTLGVNKISKRHDDLVKEFSKL